MEQPLLIEKENLEVIFNTSPDAVLITRLTDGCFVRINDGFTTMTGHTREDVIGKSILDFDIWKDPADRQTLVDILKEQGTCDNFEALFQKKDGTTISGLVSARLISLQGIPHIISVTRDNSARKLAEEELLKSKQMLELALRAAGAGTWDWDIPSEHLNWSKELFELFGLNPDHTAATFATWSQVLHPDDRELAAQRIEYAISNKLPLSSEYRIVYPGGQVHWISALGDTTYDKTGIPLKMSGICIDITDRRHTEEALRNDITARKKAEEKLKRSEEKYRKDFSTLYSLLESPVDIIIFSMDENYCYTAFTRFHRETMKKIWGVDIQAGMNVLDVISNPGDRQKAKKNFDRALSGNYFMVTEEYGDKNLYRTFYDNYYNAIKDTEGNITGVSVFVVDVTSRVEAEREFEDSRNRYRELADLLPQVIFETDINGNLTFVNKEAYRIFGYPADHSIIGLPTLSFHIPENRTRVIQNIQLRISGNPIDNNEYIMVRKDGSRFPALVYSEPKIKDNIPVGIRGIIVDITERKKTEEALRKSEEMLREAGRMAKLGGWEINLLTNELSWTDETYRIHEVDKGAKPNLGDGINYYAPEARPQLQAAIENARLNGQPFDMELPFITAKGRQLWVRSIGSAEIVDGRTVRIHGIFQDITDRKLADDQIRKMNEILEQRVAERTKELESINKTLEFHIKEIEQFSYISSHDLQEPLRTLTTFTRLIKDDYAGKLDEDGNKYIEFIHGSAVRMRALVSGLLEYSLLGKESAWSFVDCNKVADDVISDLDGLIVSSGASVSVQQLPALMGCEPDLRVLFQNLITNAIKFQKNENGPIVKISADISEKEYIFTVEDNGIGIQKKDNEKIFSIFKRLHNRNEYGGTGIGLAQCKKIVELHGGKIWVESEPGSGSVFKFTIPINNIRL